MKYLSIITMKVCGLTATAIALFVSTILASHAVDLESRTLRYSVFYGSRDAGELEIIIERTDDTIKTTAISHLSDLARMFLPGQTIETWFRIEGEKVLLDRGHILDHKDETVSSEFTIDRDNGVIDYQPRDDVPIEDGDHFESTSFPIVLMTSVVESIAGQTIRDTNPKKSRYYVYQPPAKEKLELNGKMYKTWKVTRNKRGDADRTVTFWLDRKDQKVPLKIISTKKGKSTVMTLLNPS